MLIYKDIQWIRNVKRDKGNEWAYFDEDTDEMILHWSSSYKKQPTHAMRPRLGDLVVLFQKINIDKQIHLTHLLTPVDNIERDYINTNPKHRWGRKMKILAKTQEIIKPISFNFTSVNQGHTYPVELIDKNQNKEDIQKVLWNVFQPFLKEDIYQDYINEISGNLFDDIDNPGSSEGKEKLVLHKVRERDPSLVNRKKQLAKDLICECCDFDFAKTYPLLGRGFIECHHKIPINKGERITSIEDLSLVCSNCHRMLHRRNENGGYHSIESLRKLILRNLN